MASAACIANNMNGNLMRSLVMALTSSDIGGSGAALDAARDFELLGKVADAVGGLYIITTILWGICAAYLIVKFIKRRNKSS